MHRVKLYELPQLIYDLFERLLVAFDIIIIGVREPAHGLSGENMLLN